MPTGFLNRIKGKVFVGSGTLFQAGKGSGAFGPSGQLFSFLSAAGVGNGVDTTEDNLAGFSYTLPGNSLDIINRSLWVYAWGTYAANANNKTARLYFGSVVLSGGLVTQNGGAWALEMFIAKDAANHQLGNGQLINGATHGGVADLVGTETDTAGILIKLTAQSGTAAAGNILAKGMLVGFAN